MSVPDTQYLKWSGSHDRALYENVTRKDKIQTEGSTNRQVRVSPPYIFHIMLVTK